MLVCSFSFLVDIYLLFSPPFVLFSLLLFVKKEAEASGEKLQKKIVFLTPHLPLFVSLPSFLFLKFFFYKKNWLIIIILFSNEPRKEKCSAFKIFMIIFPNFIQLIRQ